MALTRTQRQPAGDTHRVGAPSPYENARALRSGDVGVVSVARLGYAAMQRRGFEVLKLWSGVQMLLYCMTGHYSKKLARGEVPPLLLKIDAVVGLETAFAFLKMAPDS